MFLQPPNNADMRQADSASSGQYEPDLWPLHRPGVLAVCGSAGREHC